MRRLFTALGLSVVCLAAFAGTVNAATVRLAWDPNLEPEVIGYRVLVGTRSGQYPTSVDVGNVTTWTVGDLLGGVTYYFSVQAYDSAGNESAPAAPVQFTVPIVYHTARLTYDAASGVWSEPLLDAAGNAPATGPGWTIQSADFDGDGFTDYFMYNPVSGAWLKAIDNREGTYSFFGYTWAANWTPYILDLDGDRRSDVFLYNATTGRWFRCLTTGTARAGDFDYTGGVWGRNWQIVPADLNGDGRDDLFLYNGNGAADPNSGLWFRVFSVPGPDFNYVMGDFRWAPGWQVYASDFNGDRRADLFLYRGDGMWFRVLFDRPGGTSYVFGRWATNWRITPGDFNGDGRSDLFLYNASNGMWFTVASLASRGTADGVDFDYAGPGRWASGWTIAAANRNGDRMTDLVLYNATTGMWFDVISLGTAGVFDYVQGASPTGVIIVR